MRLTIFNGSPRGNGSNTKILMEQFTAGFTAGNDNQVEITYLNRTKDTGKHIEMFQNAENILLAFPLYTDCMPGIVKHFIDALAVYPDELAKPTLGFIVQSGFPEALHSRYVEKYLIKLSQRLGCRYTGTLIKGGVEGIKMKSEWMNRKLFRNMYQLGVDYAQTGQLNSEIVQKMASPERMSRPALFIIRLMIKLGLMNFYWNSQLKKHNAYEERFARPFK